MPVAVVDYGFGEFGCCYVRAFETAPAQQRPPKPCTGEVRPAQIYIEEARLAEIATVQIGGNERDGRDLQTLAGFVSRKPPLVPGEVFIDIEHVGHRRAGMGAAIGGTNLTSACAPPELN